MPDRSSIPTAGITATILILVSEAVFLIPTEALTGWPVFELAADDAVYVAKRALLNRSPGHVVLVGDSSCAMDLDPCEIQPAIGPVLNLGTIINMTPAGFAAIAEEALEKYPPPRAMVLAMLPQAFEVTETRAAEWDQLGRYLIAYGRTSPLYTPGATDHWHWFYRKHRVNVFPPELGGTFPAFAAAVSSSNGYLPERKKYTGGQVVRANFNPTPFALSGVRHLVKVAKAREVPIVLWLNPSPADSVSPDFIASVNDFLDRLRREEIDLRVPQTRIPLLEAGRFGTVTHLTPEAAKVHSRAFGESLKAVLVQ